MTRRGTARSTPAPEATKKRKRINLGKLVALRPMDLVNLYLILQSADLDPSVIEEIGQEVKAEAIESFRLKLIEAALEVSQAQTAALEAMKVAPEATEAPAEA